MHQHPRRRGPLAAPHAPQPLDTTAASTVTEPAPARASERPVSAPTGPPADAGTQKVRPVTEARPDAARPEPAGRPHRVGRPPRDRRLLVSLIAADCLAATIALAAVRPHAGLPDLLPALALLIALHQQGGLYRRGPFNTVMCELPGLLWRSGLAWSAATAVAVAVRPELTVDWARLLCLIAAHLALAALLRGGAYGCQRRRQRRRPRSALVVGDPPVAGRIAKVLHEHPEYGMRPVGLVVPRRGHERPETSRGRTGTVPPAPVALPVPVLTGTADVTRAVIQNAVCDAVLTRSCHTDRETAALVRHFDSLGCTVWVVDGESVPGGTGWRTEKAGQVWGFACSRLSPPPLHTVARVAKRALDVVVATLALLAAAPLLALCALAVRLCDGPGVLFRQERLGAHGRPFVMLKFRSLRSSAYESATRWNVAGDSRMSPVGRFLRRSSLDELPQLWNVLRGDMSLVGPRPERPYFVQQFSEAYPGYAARDRMPVGITGLAQVNGLRGDTSIEDRARFDNHYIDSWSLWQDVRILLRTAGSVFRPAGG